MKRFLLLLPILCTLPLLPNTALARDTSLLWPGGTKGLTLTPPPSISGEDFKDIYVLPARAGQNLVPYWRYDWHTYEFDGSKGGAGVRLYYYGRESDAASYAVAAIREAYDRLTEVFDSVPTSTIPFILYASSSEFQATNVFSVGEGVLGVTDPRDLRMAMPFFGNVKQFSRVFTHEMAHQFTVQKVRDAAAEKGFESPVMLFPLWFIEGLAEYGAFGGMDPEADYILRDLITDSRPAVGYALPDFFDGRAGGYIGVYKLGQARVTFIAEEYGPEKLIELLDRSPALAGMAVNGRPPQSSRTSRRPEDQNRSDAAGEGEGEEAKVEGEPIIPKSFAHYLSLVLGESEEQINGRYHDWLKRRYFVQYLDAGQTVNDFERVEGLGGEPDSISVSEDGRLIVYRTVERMTGVARLAIQDLRDPGSREVVARDQRPDLESLHPVDRRVTSLRAGKLLYSGRTGDRDVIYVRPVTTVESEAAGKTKVQIELGKAERFVPGELIEIYDPALSPDGTKVAFAGIDPGGFRDLYVLTLSGTERGLLTRLTNDVWAEANLYWDGGRLLFTCDETESHEPNLFAFDLTTKERSRLTWHKQPDYAPVPALGGVLFVSYESGKPDLWLLKDGVERRLTDTPSALLAAAPSAEGKLLALGFHRGSYQLFRLDEKSFIDEEPSQGRGGAGLVVAQDLSYPRDRLPGGNPVYKPSSSKNWRVEASAGAVVGPTSVGAAGLAITDLLRDHVLLVNVAVYGSLKLTDALVFYINQSKRPALGIGAFHTFEPRRDKTFPASANYYLQREFGVAGLARYPLDRFRRIEGSVEIRGVERFAYTDYDGNLYDDWRRLNGGTEPEIVGSAQFGYDTTILNYLAGPISGTSLVGAVSAGYLPMRGFSYARVQGDAQHRFHIGGRSSVLLRAAGGATTGGRFSPQFFLSSIGNLEGYRFGDERLLGDNYYVSNLRLTVPLDGLVMVPIFSGIFGVAGFDFGAAFDDWSTAWDRRSLSAVLGTDIGLGPLVVQLHWGRLLDVGGVPGSGEWVFNLDLRYLYF
ncbi:MAG: hypothetical protein ACOX6T_19615 [Myxococcales bacterium]